MHKVKLSFLSILGCIVLVGACGILALLAANPINQVMTYSTFLGGKFDDYSRDIAVDTAGFVYVVGETRSTNFPITAGSINSKSYDVFVAKFDPSQDGETGLIWSVVIGGSGFEKGVGIALDGEGNVYVVGSTSSSDFPSTDGTSLAGNKSIFLVRLDNDGGYGFATIIGQGGGYGPGYKDNVDIVVDSLNQIYLTGNTGDPGFFTPYGTPLILFNGDSTDAFVAKFAQTGNFTTKPLNLIYGTFIGGSSSEHAYGIAVDGFGNSYIAGGTDSSDFPTPNGLSRTLMGTYDAFMVMLDSDGSIQYGTYLGGNEGTGGGSEEISLDIAVYAGKAYVAGRTSASNFPITSEAYDESHNGGNDAFFMVLDPNQSGVDSLFYSTYLGGGSGERGVSLAVDASGNAYVFGRTLSIDFPTTPNAFDTTFNGRHDDFLAILNPDLIGEASLVSSTFWGGKRDDSPGAIALQPDFGDIYAYLSGSTGSGRDFPITSGAYDESHNGGQTDAFLSVLAFQEVNETPIVTITSPVEGSTFDSGATIYFAGTASDFEDGDITASLVWTSSIEEGQIGTDGSFQRTLSDGVHTITASVTDSGGSTGSDSISITVGTQPEPDIVSVKDIVYSTTGGKNRDKHLVIECYLDKSVEGASVSIDLERDGSKVDSFIGLTDSQGIVKFSHKNAKSGYYTSVVSAVTAAGYTWDGKTPDNNYIK